MSVPVTPAALSVNKTFMPHSIKCFTYITEDNSNLFTSVQRLAEDIV